MKTSFKFGLVLVLLASNLACFEDLDDNPVTVTEINDFVYKGMNTFYLYRENVPDLLDNKSLSPEYFNYLNGFSQPEFLFESLIYNRSTVDRFSWITSDYLALEQLFSGVSTTNGMEFGLRRYTPGGDEIYGYVRYILPNTSAESVGLERGNLFYGVNGTPLTVNNWTSLLGQDSFILNLATYDDNGTIFIDDDTVVNSSDTVDLNTVAYSENPIFKSEILTVENSPVGYLMYNGFTANFDSQLNDVFGFFQANAVQHLVIDLRYNPGGSVNSAGLLGSMVTGQFNNQVFAKLIYNNLQQASNTEFNFTSTVNNLNLNTVYILTTGASASASEMLINSLNAYIDVIHIGTNTTGKSQASITIYDSEDYRRNGANPSHTYALQPLVAISTNKDDLVVPSDGLTPDITFAEFIGNLGVLGDANEPLLAAALDHIAANNKMPETFHLIPVPEVGDSNDLQPLSKTMYLDR